MSSQIHQSRYGFKYYETHDLTSTQTFQDEEEVRERFFYPYLKEGLKFLDIGAAFGSYTLPALKRGCKVIVISPPTVEMIGLKLNLELNNFTNVKMFEKAAFSNYGYINPWTRHFVRWSHQIPSEYKTRKPSNNDSHTNNAGNHPYDYYFRTCTVDKILKNGVNFMKIDVEGAEVDVLVGAKNTIRRNNPYILVENHLQFDASIQETVISLIIDNMKLPYDYETRAYSSVSHTLFTPKVIV